MIHCLLRRSKPITLIAQSGSSQIVTGKSWYADVGIITICVIRRRRCCDAKIDWKAVSKRIGHADVAFTMKQYVQTDLEADRQVANTLAELIIGGSLTSFEITGTAREVG